MLKLWASLAATAVLCACGGGGGNSGGGGGGTPPAQATFNMDAALERALTGGASQSASASGAGGTASITISVAPQADALFEGSLRRRALETVQARLNGVLQTTETSTLFFTSGPLRIIGNIDSDGSYSVASSTGNLPTAGTVGQSGAFLTAISYTDVNRASIIGRVEQRWSLEAVTGSSNTAFACLNTRFLTPVGADTGESGSECYRIDSAGNITGLRVSVTTGGQTLVFQ